MMMSSFETWLFEPTPHGQRYDRILLVCIVSLAEMKFWERKKCNYMVTNIWIIGWFTVQYWTYRIHESYIGLGLRLVQYSFLSPNIVHIVGIDHGYAGIAVVGHAATHEGGRRPRECMLAWSTTASGAKPWSVSILSRSFSSEQLSYLKQSYSIYWSMLPTRYSPERTSTCMTSQ